MSFLPFQKKPKTLSEVVYALNEWIVRASDGNSHPLGPPGSAGAPGMPAAKHPGGSGNGNSTHRQQRGPEPITDQQRAAAEECGRLLVQIRQATWNRYTESGAPPEPEQVAALAKEVYATGVLVPLVQNLRVLDFDAQRDVVAFFGFVLKRPATMDYLLHKVPEVFTVLLGSAGDQEIHRFATDILRRCAQDEKLVAYILSLQSFWWFFYNIETGNFEVATGNFSTFQELLRNHPNVTTQFLMSNGEYFSQCMNGLIRSENYVAKRQSLKLLYTLMKQTKNQPFLMEYTAKVDNLKLVMLTLKDKSRNIHYDAFQIFKCFVANPNKPRSVVDVLIRNKVKLLDMLDKPHELSDRRDDQLFQTEREYVRKKIVALPDMVQIHRDSASPGASPGYPGVKTPAQPSPLGYHAPMGPHGGVHGGMYGGVPHPQAAQAAQLAQAQVIPTSVAAYVQQQAEPSPYPGQRQGMVPMMTPNMLAEAGRVTPNMLARQSRPLDYMPGMGGPPSPSRAQVPPALLNARPASPVLSHQQHFSEN